MSAWNAARCQPAFSAERENISFIIYQLGIISVSSKKKKMSKIKHPETIGLHGGEYRADPATTSVAVPIYQTTSYQFKNAETAANLFANKSWH